MDIIWDIFKSIIIMTCLSIDLLSCLEKWIIIIANIATISGIIVIYFQFRDYKSRQEERDNDIKAQSYQNRYELYNEMDKILVKEPQLKKLVSNEKLVEQIKQNNISEERLKELAFIEMVLNIAQLSYYQKELGRSESELKWIKELLKNEYIIEYWNSGYHCTFKKEFNDFIEDEIEKNKIEKEKSNQ